MKAVGLNCEVSRVLQGWVDAEFRPWHACSLQRAETENLLREEARRNGQICLYRVRDGSVDFAPFTSIHRPFLLDPAHSGGARAHAYLRHLQDVVHTFDLKGSALIGMFVADLHLPRTQAPVFCFQKRLGDRGLLLPDVDLISDDYCSMDNDRYNDSTAFEQKRRQAIFVGSTTSSEILTIDHVNRRSDARLNAAIFFREQPDVVFDLPNIVQVDNEATRLAIEQLGVCGRFWSSTEQQDFRYMLSLDGNGATCGRVTAALHCNQLLAKYNSVNVLYYFHGMKPWFNYVPINEHGDVLDLIANCQRDFGLHLDIANQSRVFAQSYLTRIPIMHFSALMLSRYIYQFGGGGSL